MNALLALADSASGTVVVPVWLITLACSALAAAIAFAVAWGMQRQAIKSLVDEVHALRREVAELRKEVQQADKAVAVLGAVVDERQPTGQHQAVSSVQLTARKP